MNKAAFLDRDGVINREASKGKYITSVAQLEILPRVEYGIRKFNEADYRVFVVTNQRGIAKNELTLRDLEKIHEHMWSELKKEDAHIDGIYFCPHDENSCECRKPKPGMLYQAMKEYDLDIKNSWMIGNSEKDILAGKSAGCKTILIGSKISPDGFLADHIASDLYEASILAIEGTYPRIII
jgi:histidinol-phosphate phosphatase family protein